MGPECSQAGPSTAFGRSEPHGTGDSWHWAASGRSFRHEEPLAWAPAWPESAPRQAAGPQGWRGGRCRTSDVPETSGEAVCDRPARGPLAVLPSSAAALPASGRPGVAAVQAGFRAGSEGAPGALGSSVLRHPGGPPRTSRWVTPLSRPTAEETGRPSTRPRSQAAGGRRLWAWAWGAGPPLVCPGLGRRSRAGPLLDTSGRPAPVSASFTTRPDGGRGCTPSPAAVGGTVRPRGPFPGQIRLGDEGCVHARRGCRAPRVHGHPWGQAAGGAGSAPASARGGVHCRGWGSAALGGGGRQPCTRGPSEPRRERLKSRQHSRVQSPGAPPPAGGPGSVQ